MKQLIKRSLAIARTGTMKDTAVLFIGNLSGAMLGFLLLLLLARALTVEEMGIFSAFTNLVLLVSSMADPGVSSALVKFIAEHDAKAEIKKTREYLSAGLNIQVILFLISAVVTLLFSSFVAKKLLATENTFLAIIMIATIFANVLWNFISQALRARRQFLYSSVVDVVTAFFRLTGVFIFGIFTMFSVNLAASIYSLATLLGALLGFYLFKERFLFIKASKHTYISLLKFSSWIGVNKISSTIAGKIDVQMLAILSGAFSTGIYSVPARLIFFVSLLIASFSSVIAPRLASFETHEKEKKYLIKTTYFSLLIIVGLAIWYLISEPFILVLFGEKYHGSIEIFRLLLISMIPFVLTAPSVNAIIYSLKKPQYIGYFSVVQLIAIIILNYILIPIYGALGPTYSLIIINIALAIYSWSIVIKHYNSNEKN